MYTLWLANIDILAEEQRADFRREAEKFRLQREAQETKPRKPGWREHRMLDLSLWIMTIGKRLYQRYHNSDPIPRWHESLKIAR